MLTDSDWEFEVELNWSELEISPEALGHSLVCSNVQHWITLAHPTTFSLAFVLVMHS